MKSPDWEIYSHDDCADGAYRLYLAIIRQALQDAAVGDESALAFLRDWGLTHLVAGVKVHPNRRHFRDKVAA